MELWGAGAIFGFIAGGTLAYFVGHDEGIKRGKKIACKWLLKNAKACERASREGIHKVDNAMEAQTIYSYIEHIKDYDGNG